MIMFRNLPVDAPLRITSEFGKRYTGIKGATTFHNGIDLGRDWSKSYTNILCVRWGKVVENEWNDYRGWFITIDHGIYKTRYQHLRNKSTFKVGVYVKAGTVIGIMGDSANPKVLDVPIHLHFEIIIGGKTQNPKQYLIEVSGGDYMEIENAIKIIKEKAELDDNTIQYLLFYKYGKELILKLASVL